jgi:hypothetical protein
VVLLGRIDTKDRLYKSKEGLAIIYLLENTTSRFIYVHIYQNPDHGMAYGISNGEVKDTKKISYLLDHPLGKFHLENNRKLY